MLHAEYLHNYNILWIGTILLIIIRAREIKIKLRNKKNIGTLQ